MAETDTRAVKTEADALAAASCYDELTGTPGRTNPREMQGDWLAIRFARHRLSVLSQAEARVGDVVRDAAAKIGCFDPDWRSCLLVLQTGALLGLGTSETRLALIRFIHAADFAQGVAAEM